MTSPTHAFIVYPYLENVRRGWEDPLYTYSWIRDQIILPQKQFYEQIVLTEQQQLFLREEWFLHLGCRASQGGALLQEVSIEIWRTEMLSAMGNPSWSEKMDGFLYETFPLIAGVDIQREAQRLLEGVIEFSLIESILEKLPARPWITAKKFQDLVKRCCLLAMRKRALSFDLHDVLTKRARELALLPPAPFIFGDTNWMGYVFAFVVNPATLQLELWRVDRIGLTGFPMTTWKHCFDGKQEVLWHLFARPSEYRL